MNRPESLPSSPVTHPDRPEPSAETRRPSRFASEWIAVFIPAFLGVLALFAVTWHFVQPAPPTHVTIATGPKEGAYYAMAQKYVGYFREAGIRLDVKETGGSIDNFKLLNEAGSGVDIAIVQAGTSPPDMQDGRVQAVAGIYFEPVLLFYRGDLAITRLSQLTGKKIAVGADGSGVRVVAKLLLDEAGVIDKTAGTALLPTGGDEAADALIGGKIDAAVYVIAPDSPVVKRLLAAPGVHLMSFDHAHAYGRLHPFLSATTLYRGSVDVQRNLPDVDIDLVAAPATLAVRSTTHSAIVQLLVRAAQEYNRNATLLSDPGIFPNAGGSELPFDYDARYFLANPPNILHRTLPFWLASLIDRLIILVLPLLVVLIPLFRLTPVALNWRVQRKLLLRYKRVRQIEQQLSARSSPEELRSAVDELAVMDRDLAKLKLPTSSSKDLYDLRNSVEYVRGRLQQWLGDGETKPGVSPIS